MQKLFENNHSSHNLLIEGRIHSKAKLSILLCQVLHHFLLVVDIVKLLVNQSVQLLILLHIRALALFHDFLQILRKIIQFEFFIICLLLVEQLDAVGESLVLAFDLECEVLLQSCQLLLS